jgi:hypothetical protein
MPLWKYQRIRRTLRATRLKLLTEGDLLGAQTLFTVYGSPTRGGMTAAQELLIDTFVTRPAVAGG